jgi:hypothetical protein
VDSSHSRYGPVAGSCEHGNEYLVSIKDDKFLKHDYCSAHETSFWFYRNTFRKLDLFSFPGIKRGEIKVFLLSLAPLNELGPVIETSSFKETQLSRKLSSLHTWRRKQIQFRKRFVCKKPRLYTVQKNSQVCCDIPSSETLRFGGFIDHLSDY